MRIARVVQMVHNDLIKVKQQMDLRRHNIIFRPRHEYIQFMEPDDEHLITFEFLIRDIWYAFCFHLFFYQAFMGVVLVAVIRYSTNSFRSASVGWYVWIYSDQIDLYCWYEDLTMGKGWIFCHIRRFRWVLDSSSPTWLLVTWLYVGFELRSYWPLYLIW